VLVSYNITIQSQSTCIGPTATTIYCQPIAKCFVADRAVAIGRPRPRKFLRCIYLLATSRKTTLQIVVKIFTNQSINQYIYNAPWYRGACYSAHYAETKRNVLSRILNVLTDGAVQQFRGNEFQSLAAATEKRRAAVSKLCAELTEISEMLSSDYEVASKFWPEPRIRNVGLSALGGCLRSLLLLYSAVTIAVTTSKISSAEDYVLSLFVCLSLRGRGRGRGLLKPTHKQADRLTRGHPECCNLSKVV